MKTIEFIPKASRTKTLGLAAEYARRESKFGLAYVIERTLQNGVTKIIVCKKKELPHPSTSWCIIFMYNKGYQIIIEKTEK